MDIRSEEVAGQADTEGEDADQIAGGSQGTHPCPTWVLRTYLTDDEHAAAAVFRPCYGFIGVDLLKTCSRRSLPGSSLVTS